jgi:hypothetical protein
VRCPAARGPANQSETRVREIRTSGLFCTITAFKPGDLGDGEPGRWAVLTLWRRGLGTVCRDVGILIAEMAVRAIDGSVSRPREMLRVNFGAGAVNSIIYSRLHVLFAIYRC